MVNANPEYHTRIIGEPPPGVTDECQVLIIRKGFLGDTVMTFPLLAALPECWEKTYLAPFPQAELATSFVDYVCDIDNPKINYFDYDVALNLLHDPDESISKAILSAGIKTVVTPPFLIRPDTNVGSLLLGALEPLGITKFNVTPKLVTKTKKRTKTIAFHPSSSREIKNWPLNKWISLIKYLDTSEVLLIGGANDQEIIAEFIKECPCQVLYNVSLLQLAERLAECMLFIGHDTGTTHLAAAVGTPTIALFGGLNPRVWGPRGDHVRYITSSTVENLSENVMTLSPMDNITVDFVLEKVRSYCKQLL